MGRVFVWLSLLVAAPALANGAFPDSQQLMLPPDNPMQIAVGTNFGLLLSSDGGSKWYWVCETAVTQYPKLFQMGPPPSSIFYTISSVGLFSSQDLGCTWKVASGLTKPDDFFPDPNDATRLLAIAAFNGDGGSEVSSLFESHDSGITFGAPTLPAPANGYFTGVELSTTQPETLYVTQFVSQPSPGHASVLRSTDGGKTFETYDLSAVLGSRIVRLVGVDPKNANRIFLRVLSAEGDALAISDNDGGKTLRIAQNMADPMTSFLLRSDGTIITASRAQAFISSDGGKTFSAWANAPHLRALAERGGQIYALADNYRDGFALATTTDLGATWTPILRYSNVLGPATCGSVQAICGPQWPAMKARLDMNDGGTSITDDMGTDDMAAPLPPNPGDPKVNGHGCGVTQRQVSPSPWLLGLAALALVVWALRAATRRSGSP